MLLKYFICCIYILVIQTEYFVLGILGGYPIRIEDAPHQVNYGDVCGGVIIRSLWALTSAHCGKESFIRIGSKYRLKGRKVRIVKHVVHPKYARAHRFDYDIQLLRFNKRLHFHDKVNAIDLGDEVGDEILVAGWGYSEEKGSYLHILHEVKLDFVTKYECQQVDKYWYNHTLTNRMFCAGAWRKDACQGDSGGGAVSDDKLVGLSSFGFGCGRNIPGVYLDLTEITIQKWIYSNAVI